MISVCMATYNGEKYVKEQIESILTQLSADDELIISDDGSTDSTIEIINKIGDKRVKLYHHTQDNPTIPNVNKVTKNFEYALSKSSGDYIFLSDQDDIWMSDKVATMLSALQKHDIVVSDGKVLDGEGNIVSETLLGDAYKLNRWQTLILRTPYPGCCMAFRRKVLEKALPFPERIQAHDRWLGFVGRFFYDFAFIRQGLILYRRHGDNTSTMTGKSRNSLSYRIRERVRFATELLKRALK